MGFQTTVNLTQAFGVQGEIVYDGPVRANPWQLISTPQTNVIGATAYTITSGATDTGSGTAQAGGTGVFAGVLAAPKNYANFNGGLTPTLTLADDTIGELVTMGTIILYLTTAANPGDLLTFNTTTGALASTPPTCSFSGSTATNVLTLTVAASTQLGVGSTFVLSNGQQVTIDEVLSGTGGIGSTYQLNISPGTLAAAAYVTTNAIAPTGFAFVPHGKVILRSTAANGLAICELTD